MAITSTRDTLLVSCAIEQFSTWALLQKERDRELMGFMLAPLLPTLLLCSPIPHAFTPSSQGRPGPQRGRARSAQETTRHQGRRMKKEGAELSISQVSIQAEDAIR